MGDNEFDSIDHDQEFSRLFEDLLDDVQDLVRTKKTRDDARAGCDGNWGHFGSHEEDRLEKASAKVESRLKAMIDARIVAVLSNQQFKAE